MFAEAIRLRELGQFAESGRILQKLIELDPGNAAALAVLGYLYWTLTRYNEAIEAFAPACALRPRNSRTSAGLFHACLEAGRTDEAIAEAKRYVALLDSENPPKIHKDLPNLEATYREWATDDEAAIAALRSAYRPPLRLVPKGSDE
jgi:tetratricopeptide (TPR) repeat protein